MKRLLLFCMLALAVEAQATQKGIWITTGEIMALPMSGAAWNTLQAEANSVWEMSDMTAQNSDWPSQTLAGALVAVRTNDAALFAKTADSIMAGKRTMDDATEFAGTGFLDQYLMHTISRQVMGMVFAADIIDLDTYAPALGAEFRSWLSNIRTQYVPSGPAIHNLQNWAEDPTDNGASRAMGSILAAELYLDTPGKADRYWNFFRAFGDRSFYPSDAAHNVNWDNQTYHYYFPTTFDAEFSCNPMETYTAVSPACDKFISGSLRNIDGSLVSDASRSAVEWPINGDGKVYSWVSLGGITAVAEMLHRLGYRTWEYTPIGTSVPMLLRTLEFMDRAGASPPNTAFRWIPWLVNSRYGTIFSAPTPQVHEFSVSWTDWTHGGQTVAVPSSDMPISARNGYYDLAGRRLDKPPASGLYWRVTNGQPRKLVRVGRVSR